MAARKCRMDLLQHMDGKSSDILPSTSLCHQVVPCICNRHATRAAQVSFYPQLYLNYSRQNVVGAHTPVYLLRCRKHAFTRADTFMTCAAGLSFDFVLYNEISFIFYAAFSCALMFSPGVRESYRERHDSRDPGVRCIARCRCVTACRQHIGADSSRVLSTKIVVTCLRHGI